MLKVVELFAGIGSPRKALKNLNIDHEVVAFSEIDKYAIESYRAIHDDCKTPNLGDITEVKELPLCDLLVFGSPCQDISIAGNQKGIQEGTRSGLLLEVLRLLEVASNKNQLPRYLLLENVSNILSKDHVKEFREYLIFLEKLGYKNFYKILNATDYGMPQNRERLFSLSVLDKKLNYNFPPKKKLDLRLKDLLESEVDKKYFLSDEKTKAFIEKHKEKILELEQGIYPVLTPEKLNVRQNGRVIKDKDDPAFTQTTIDRHGVLLIGSLTEKNSQGERVYTTDQAVTLSSGGGGLGAKTGLYMVGNVNPGGKGMNGSVFSEEGICPTLTTNKGEGIKIIGSLDIGGQRGRVYSDIGSIGCLTSTDYKVPPKILINLRIRRLTPLECFRLMGFTDIDFYRAKEKLNETFYKGRDNSNSQLYKQAGNSIVVNVLESIFRNLFLEEETPIIQKLF